MESIEFIATMVAASVIIVWYIHNEAAGAAGSLGLLALIGIQTETKRATARSYRKKQRTAGARRHASPTDEPKQIASASKSYRALPENERLQRKFQRQDEVRYRVKDKLVAKKSGKAPAED